MTTAPKLSADDLAIKAAMGVARDVAEGRVSLAAIDAEVAAECRLLFGTVIGPPEPGADPDPLWALQLDVCLQVLSMGGVEARELAQWLSVARIYERTAATVGETWMDQVLQALADEDDEPDHGADELTQMGHWTR